MTKRIDHWQSKSMSLKRRLATRFLEVLPTPSRLLYGFCKKYVDLFNNDNNSDFYTNGELTFMLERLKTSKIVFDIGSNIGEWAQTALHINPNISLHCFEPCATTFSHLAVKKFPVNVKLNRIGLGSARGELVLYVNGDNCELNSIHRRASLDGKSLQAERIAVDTVDNYCSTQGINHIDFVKVDVEGHELEVFKGMQNMLGQASVKFIQFEYGGNPEARVFLGDIWDFFSDLTVNYSFHKLYPHGPVKFSKYSPKTETFQYSNWAIIRVDEDIPLP